MAPAIEAVTEGLTLGEGPHWHAPTRKLYFVDIFGQTINKYDPETMEHFKAKIGTLIIKQTAENFIYLFLLIGKCIRP